VRDFSLSAVADGGEGINPAEVLAAGNYYRSGRADEVLK